MLPGRSVVWTPTGIGKVRGSTHRVGDGVDDEEPVVALEAEELGVAAFGRAFARRRSSSSALGCRSAGRPSACSGCRDRTSARLTRPSVSISRQRSGIGNLVGRKGLGRRRADRARIGLADPLREGRAAGRRAGGGRRSARLRAVIGGVARDPRGSRLRRLACGRRRGSGLQAVRGASSPVVVSERDEGRCRVPRAHFPWQTFWSVVPRNGANGQLT